MYQSWDVAVTTNGDYSVCTTWLVIKKNYYLIDVWRGRIEFPALKRKAIQLAQLHSINGMLIEKSGVGLPLYTEMRDESPPRIPKPVGIKPLQDKISRFEGVSARIEGGQVYLPEDAPWLDTYLTELLGFPATKYDDQVDSTSQFLEWIRSRSHRSMAALGGPKVFIGEPSIFASDYGYRY